MIRTAAIILLFAGCETVQPKTDVTADEQVMLNAGAAVCEKVGQPASCFTVITPSDFGAMFGEKISKDDLNAYFIASKAYWNVKVRRGLQ